ncbi:MAG TPA: DUF177 domain-containing protein [Thermoanaerobaculia bacterium]|nr:DUF177 domain-containing protein [Thermoanaerobaculia bacterium]
MDQVREEPCNWNETERITLEELDRPELLAVGPVAWRGQVVYADPGFFLRGHLSYDQTVSCNRCLTPIHEPVSAEVELMILVERPAGGGSHGGSEHELKEEDLGTLTLEGEILDTHPIILEQVQLNVPMKPLCRPDCQGLCPVCGIDRNTGSCSCEERTADTRWAPLAALKGRLTE